MKVEETILKRILKLFLIVYQLMKLKQKLKVMELQCISFQIIKITQ